MRLFLILAGLLLAASLTSSFPDEQEEIHPPDNEGKTETKAEEDASASNSTFYSTREMRDMCLKEWAGKTEEIEQYFDQLPSSEFKENSEDLKFKLHYERKGLWDDDTHMMNITAPPPRHLPGPEYSIEVNDSYVPKYRTTTREEDRMIEDGTFNSHTSESSEELITSSEKKVKTGKKLSLPLKKKTKEKRKWPENMDPITDGIKKKKKKRKTIDGEKKKKRVDSDDSEKSGEDKKKRKKKRKSDSEKETSGEKKKKKRPDLEKGGEKKRKRKKTDSESTESDGEEVKRKRKKSDSGSDDSNGDNKKSKNANHENKASGKKVSDTEKKNKKADSDKKNRKEKVEKDLNSVNRPRVKLISKKQKSNLQEEITPQLQLKKPQDVPHSDHPSSKKDVVLEKQEPGKLHSSSNTKNTEKESDSVLNKLLASSKLRERQKKRPRKSQNSNIQPRPYL